jgi:predicted dienelactone hydrolase
MTADRGTMSLNPRTSILLAIIAVVIGGTAGAGAAPSRYAVGVTAITFTKSSVTTGEPRPLITTIWYPAAAGTGTPEALGLRDADVYAKRFPLIVFSHGNCGRPAEASYLTMALASRGFVVAAPAHLGNTKDRPDCGANFVDSFQNRVPDVMFVVDSMLAETASTSSRFTDRLQPDAIGISGLSFGGYTTLVAAQRDSRLRAALSMVPGGVSAIDANDITIPTMVLGAERDRVVGFPDSEAAYKRIAGPRFLVELLASDHLSVTDDCFPLCSPEYIPQDEAHRIVLHFALPFFRYYLTQGQSQGAGLIRAVPHAKLTAEPRRAGGGGE